MLKTLLKPAKKFFYNGTSPEFKSSFNRSVIFTNALTFTGMIVIPSIYAQLTKLGVDSQPISLYYILLSCLPLIPLSNYFGKVYCSLGLCLGFLLTGGWLAGIFFGKTFNGHYFFFIALTYSVIAFSQLPTKYRVVITGLTFLNFPILDWLSYNRSIPITGLSSYDFPITLLLSDTLVIPFLLIVVIWIEKSMADSHEKQLEEALVQVNSEKQKIQTILDNIDLGIMITDSDLKISNQFSKSVNKIVDEKDPSGQNLMDYLFDSEARRQEQIATTVNILNVCIGEDSLNWDLNFDKLVKEHSRTRGDQIQHLKFSWSPIISSDIIEKIIVSVDDITSEKLALQQVEEEKAIQVSIQHMLRSLMKVGKASTISFCGDLMEFCVFKPAGLGKLEIQQELHRFKGEARLRDLIELSELIHNMEEVLKTHDLESQHWKDSLSELRQASINLVKARELLLSDQPQTSSTWSMTAYLLELLKSLNKNPEAENLASYFGHLDMKIEVDQMPLSFRKPLQEALLHIIQNGIDHGYKIPGLNKPVDLFLHSFSKNNELIFEFGDGGNGLNIEKLQKIFNELPTERRKQISSVEEVVFLENASTAEKISLTSGRGIGLSAVKTSIEKLGGQVSISNRAHGGTLITLRIPWREQKNLKKAS